MRSSRKLALTLAATAAALVVAIVALPYLFRDRIANRLRAELARSVNARVAWKGAGLDALADFPNLRLTLDDVSVVGVKPFAGDTLVGVGRARLVLDLASVVRFLRSGDRVVVREVALERPALHLRVLADGAANWDIARRTDSVKTGGSRAIALTLRALGVRDGVVTLDDRRSGLAAAVVGLQETLAGDFAKSDFVLSTHTRADSVSLRFAGVPYLSRVAVALDADVAADMRAHRFTFRNDSLRLNDLLLAFSGSVTAGDPDIGIDLAFSSPSTAFRDILSLVAVVYAHDFARLQTAGRMSAAGRVSGAFGPKAFPKLALRARVEGGAFKYPDLPLPARDISADIAVDNPGGSADSTVVALKRFHAVVGQQPLDASFVVRTPVSDPDVDLRVAGAMSLADLARTVKLGGVRQLSGRAAADVAVRARLSQIDAGRYENVAAGGTLTLSRVSVESASLPHAVNVDTAALRFTPRRAELTSFAARVGGSDARATGSLDNVLAFALRGDVLRGQATVTSERVNLDEWKSSDDALEVIPVPANVDFALQAAVGRVTYGAITAANVHGGLRVKDRRVTLDDLRMEMLRGSVVANGYYETTNLARPTFDLGLKVVTLDVPSAFAALTAVQKLAPVAKWAQGSVSGDVALKGPLGHDMMPAFDALTGTGSIASERLVLQGVPVLTKLAESLKIEQLRNPALQALRTSFEITDGRLRVKPFDLHVGGTRVTVAGSHGIDQSLAYDLALAVPRTELGAAAGGVVARLASQAGKVGLDLKASDVVELAAHVTGTVTDPNVRPDFAGVASSASEAAHYAVQQQVETRVAAVKERADSAAEDARRRARAEADRITAEAEQQAAKIREEARALAARARDEAGVRADSLVSRASSPAARIAAKLAADRLRREADQQAEKAVREADARADAVVQQAKQRANALAASGG